MKENNIDSFLGGIAAAATPAILGAVNKAGRSFR